LRAPTETKQNQNLYLVRFKDVPSGAGVTRRPPSRRQANWSSVNSSTERSKLKTGRHLLVDCKTNWSTPTRRL